MTSSNGRSKTPAKLLQELYFRHAQLSSAIRALEQLQRIRKSPVASPVLSHVIRAVKSS